MDIDITVPTDKADLNKTITVSVNPANKNVTAGGSCGTAKNGTKQVAWRLEGQLSGAKYCNNMII